MTSGSGYIDLDEFKSVVTRKLKQDADEKELKEIFRVLDKEKKGEVNVNEIRYVERRAQCKRDQVR